MISLKDSMYRKDLNSNSFQVERRKQCVCDILDTQKKNVLRDHPSSTATDREVNMHR